VRYGVTGAAGFIGSHLCEELARRGHDVVGFDCYNDYYDPRLKERNAEGLDVRRVDLAEAPLDFNGLDGLVHLAGQPGVRSFGDVFPLYIRRNVLASQRVFEAAARDGVRVVYASSSSIYGDAETYPTPETTPPRPISPYGITKLAAEHLAYAYRTGFRLDCVIVRYFTVYGPRQRPDMAFTRLATALVRGKTFELYGDGWQSRGFTYVADAVDATIRALEHGSGTYNVGGGTEATMNEVIALLEALSGRTLRLEHKAVAKGDVRRTNADTTRIRSELGWDPQTSLEDGLRAQLEWLESGG
jgi:nucleoside-diphosphate-sugar epimerase